MDNTEFKYFIFGPNLIIYDGFFSLEEAKLKYSNLYHIGENINFEDFISDDGTPLKILNYSIFKLYIDDVLMRNDDKYWPIFQKIIDNFILKEKLKKII